MYDGRMLIITFAELFAEREIDTTKNCVNAKFGTLTLFSAFRQHFYWNRFPIF